MQYTVKQLASLAGVSARTLRYYDQIGLLRPAGTTESGYRLYGADEVDKLQQILFYREMGMGLEQIREIVNAPDFDVKRALLAHRASLLQQRARLDALLETVERSLAGIEGRTVMTDREKFEAFKKRMIDENEVKYGEEARAKYGDEAVDASNAKLMGMSEAQWQRFTALQQELMVTLLKAMDEGNPKGKLGRRTAELHREWLSFTWNHYSPEAHAGLADMYVADERFTAYYDQHRPGAAAFLRDCIKAYTATLADQK